MSTTCCRGSQFLLIFRFPGSWGFSLGTLLLGPANLVLCQSQKERRLPGLGGGEYQVSGHIWDHQLLPREFISDDQVLMTHLNHMVICIWKQERPQSGYEIGYMVSVLLWYLPLESLQPGRDQNPQQSPDLWLSEPSWILSSRLLGGYVFIGGYHKQRVMWGRSGSFRWHLTMSFLDHFAVYA